MSLPPPVSITHYLTSFFSPLFGAFFPDHQPYIGWWLAQSPSPNAVASIRTGITVANGLSNSPLAVLVIESASHGQPKKARTTASIHLAIYPPLPIWAVGQNKRDYHKSYDFVKIYGILCALTYNATHPRPLLEREGKLVSSSLLSFIVKEGRSELDVQVNYFYEFTSINNSRYYPRTY